MPARAIATFRAANLRYLACVYCKDIDTGSASPVLLSKHLPLQALRIRCDRLAKPGRIKFGIADIIHAATSDRDIQENLQADAGGRPLDDQCLRRFRQYPSWNRPEDFFLSVGLSWRIPPNSPLEERAKKLLALVFRGLGVEDTSA